MRSKKLYEEEILKKIIHKKRKRYSLEKATHQEIMNQKNILSRERIHKRNNKIWSKNL